MTSNALVGVETSLDCTVVPYMFDFLFRQVVLTLTAFTAAIETKQQNLYFL